MMRVWPVLAVAIAISACASKAPQPAAAPSLSAAPYASASPATMETTPAAAAWATVSPRLSQRARCFENRGVWRPTAYVCEYEGL